MMKFKLKGCLALGALVGGLYALTIFDLSFILGQSAHWQQPFGDTITNFIGAIYFAQDSWRWPLLYIPNLAFPEGTSIIYTDSIPLLALLGKILYKVTGVWFNYFGVWIFACFSLLGLCIALTMWENQCKDPLVILGAVLLGLSCPAFLVRYGHAALMAHFLIVWGFYLYLKFRHKPLLAYFIFQSMVIVTLTILIQSYFLLIVLLFFGSALFQAVKDKHIKFYSAIFVIFIILGTIVLNALIGGVIGSNSAHLSMAGFGYYSMNVLSPFLPIRDHLPEMISQHVQWDGNGYSWDATGGQYEGYNYFGAGVILMLMISSFTVSRDTLKEVFKNHFFLLLALFGLLLIALSNKVYVGNWLVIDVSTGKLLGKLLSYFRTGGRFFWPIYYVVVVALVLFLLKRFSSQYARLVLIFCVALQLIDTQPIRHHLMVASHTPFPKKLSHKTWASIIAAHQFIEQYPSFQCGGWSGGFPDNNSNLEFLLIAAKQNKLSNSAYLARSSRDCMQERMQGQSLTSIKKGGLYVFAKQFPIHQLRADNHFKKWCREFQYGFICTKSMNLISQMLPLHEFKIPSKEQIPSYILGRVLRFTVHGNGEPFLWNGWYLSEPWGTWTKGKESEIFLKVSNLLSDQYLLEMHAFGFVHPAYPTKRIDVYINNKRVATWVSQFGKESKRYTAKFSKSIFQKDNVLRIKLLSDKFESPKHVGISKDKREISFGVIDLSVKSLSGKV